MDTYGLIVKVLEEKLGYIVFDKEAGDFAISDYIEDSLEFIQFILQLEEYIGAELTDEFLDNQLLESARGFSEKLSDFMT